MQPELRGMMTPLGLRAMLCRYRFTGAAASVATVAIFAGSTAVADVGHQHSKKMVGGEPGKASEVARTIRLVAGDIKFDKKTITVKAGETVRFVVTNKGEMVHDLTLGTEKVQAGDRKEGHRKEMLEMMNKGMELGKMDHSDPNAVTIKPGESKELIWKFEKAQTFEFACNVPGHYESGMKGDIVIR